MSKIPRIYIHEVGLDGLRQVGIVTGQHNRWIMRVTGSKLAYSKRATFVGPINLNVAQMK